MSLASYCSADVGALRRTSGPREFVHNLARGVLAITTVATSGLREPVRPGCASRRGLSGGIRRQLPRVSYKRALEGTYG